MVRAFRLLQLVERGRMVPLPFEPTGEPVGGLLLGGADALDAEEIAGVFADGVRHPSAVAFGTEDLHDAPKRDGPSGAMRGSTRPSSIASATSFAVIGASSTPFR